MKKFIIISSLIISIIALGIYGWKALGYLVYRYPKKKGDYVVLMHGLWSSPLAMMKIGDMLAAQNYNVINVGYPSSQKGIKTISREYLTEVIEKNCVDKSKKINFVTHSMGGIVTRDYINSLDNTERIGKVVMLAPPNNGSEIVDNFRGIKVLEMIIGPAGMELGTDSMDTPKTLGDAKVPTGVVIGTGKTFPLIGLFVDEVNDGMVTLQSAKLSGMKDFKVDKSSHTMITFSDDVIECVIRFLKDEKFS